MATGGALDDLDVVEPEELTYDIDVSNYSNLVFTSDGE